MTKSTRTHAAHLSVDSLHEVMDDKNFLLKACYLMFKDMRETKLSGPFATSTLLAEYLGKTLDRTLFQTLNEYLKTGDREVTEALKICFPIIESMRSRKLRYGYKTSRVLSLSLKKTLDL